MTRALEPRHCALAAVLGLCFGLATPAHAAGPPATPKFTAAQVERGKSAYAQNCASCHGPGLEAGEFGPPLKGPAFLDRWGGRPLADLSAYLHTNMPPGRVGELNNDTYTGLIALLLNANGVAASAQELPADPQALTSMRLPGEARSEQAQLRSTSLGAITPGVKLPVWPKKASPLDRYTPVTEAMLNAPPDGEWLARRRTHDALGFSPLKQINRRNVGSLRLA